MPEWLYEAGIGEDRAALVEDGAILEARIEPKNRPFSLGSTYLVTITKVITPGILAEGELGSFVYVGPRGKVMVRDLPADHRMSVAVKCEVVREPLYDGRKMKLAVVRPISPDHPFQHYRALPSFRERLTSEYPVRDLPPQGPDLLEEAGWSELLDEAKSGLVSFACGSISLTPTPGGTVIDIDGWLAPEQLARAAAPVAGQAIRRLGLGGSILLDFPSFPGRQARQAVAEAVIASLPPPFEQTGLNGFGLMQIVRQRPARSLLEEWRDHRVEREACELIRRAQRSGLTGAVAIVAPPTVRRFIDEQSYWLTDLSRELGGEARVETEKGMELGEGYIRKA